MKYYSDYAERRDAFDDHNVLRDELKTAIKMGKIAQNKLDDLKPPRRCLIFSFEQKEVYLEMRAVTSSSNTAIQLTIIDSESQNTLQSLPVSVEELHWLLQK